MKPFVRGKNIFTVESINKGKPEMKPETRKAVRKIVELMKSHGIIEVTV